jgi:hypothetical protein
MKHTSKKLLSFVITITVLFSATALYAQCLTNSLVVNTGYANPGQIAVNGSDPHWVVSALTPEIMAAVSTPTPPYAAIRPTYSGWTATDPNATWLSFYNPTGTWYTTTPSPDDYTMTLTRTFTLCMDDDIDVNFQIARDNWVRILKIDGTTLFTETSNMNVSNYTSFTSVTPVTLSLAAGPHTIEVEVVDFHINNQPNAANPHGFELVGTVSSATGNNSIIEDNGCPDYVCSDEPPPSDCDDKCFWKVQGNNIIGSNNIFGTLTQHNVRIKTNNVFRGIMDTKGQLGWNTMSPTAYLHVLCTKNNPDDGSAGTSDVRFEKLEPGHGNILVIDQQGYVFDSRMRLNDDGTIGREKDMMRMLDEEKAKTLAMEARVMELEKQVQQLMTALSVADPAKAANTLEQNVPNPFGTQTVIGYYIQAITSSAYIILHDLKGREVARYDITKAGKGEVTVNNSKLISGDYVYTLYVNSQRIDSKRMVVIEK